MTLQKSRSIESIENRMEGLQPGSFRYKALESAKNFKSSWMELGQYLCTVYKDKLYKEWGYLTFEAYCAKEIGIRQPTAVKLLKSYAFLEKEEPSYLKQSLSEERRPTQVPSYESVNALRLAKESERVPEAEYRAIRSDVLNSAKEEDEVKKKIRYVLKANPKPLSPEEKEDKKDAVLRRTINTLRNSKAELSEFSFPAKILKQIDDVIALLSEYQK